MQNKKDECFNCNKGVTPFTQHIFISLGVCKEVSYREFEEYLKKKQT
jgi:C4-type Zn-finger protein